MHRMRTGRRSRYDLQVCKGGQSIKGIGALLSTALSFRFPGWSVSLAMQLLSVRTLGIWAGLIIASSRLPHGMGTVTRLIKILS